MNSTLPRTVGDLFPSKWVKPEDLRNTPVTVRITDVTVENLRQPDGSTKPAAVLTFLGKDKRLILNKTQAKALADLTGSDVLTDWVGRSVTLKPAVAPNGRPTIAIVAPLGQGSTGA